MNNDWRPIARPSFFIRVRAMFWAWVAQRARLRGYDNDWGKGL